MQARFIRLGIPAKNLVCYPGLTCAHAQTGSCSLCSGVQGNLASRPCEQIGKSSPSRTLSDHACLESQWEGDCAEQTFENRRQDGYQEDTDILKRTSTEYVRSDYMYGSTLTTRLQSCRWSGKAQSPLLLHALYMYIAPCKVRSIPRYIVLRTEYGNSRETGRAVLIEPGLWQAGSAADSGVEKQTTK